ncbi:MAG: nucleotide exchange factor GrpE [Bryobacterales bacterium]|nr:nucleotide exchange factor GrpE [Bryobacterales bacterium]
MFEKLLRLRTKPRSMNEPNDVTNPVNPPVADGEALREPEESTGTANELAQLMSERERLEFENADLRDQTLRLRAEFDNFRRRVAREKEEILDHANMESARALLAIVDDFERALAVESSDANYAKGMELIYGRFSETLKKLGVEPMEAKGHLFDPNLHHAIDMVKTDEAPDHTILQVFQNGYLFKGKLLRPAIVKVAVSPDGDSAERPGPAREIN